MKLPAALAAFAACAPFVAEATPSVFVINLAYRPERLARFDEQAKSAGLQYTRIDAADPEIATQELQAGRVALNATYRDPWSFRVMKLGEVGCALSHIRSWGAIASAVPDSEYGVVLEDDVRLRDVFPEGIVERLDAIERGAAQHGVDVVYLSFKARSDDDKRYPVDDLFQTCNFCYWANAYLIRSSAAKRLVADVESYRQNLIPSDEYLPIVLGALDLSSEGECSGTTEECSDDDALGRDPRYPNVRLSCLALREQVARPQDDGYAFSDTEHSAIVDSHPTDDRLLILTVAADETHFGYKALRRTANTFGYKLVNVHQKSTEWNMVGAGDGLNLALVKRFLDGYDDDEQIVAFTGGYDSLFQEVPEWLLGTYWDHPADVVFAADHWCWPDEDVCDRYSKLLDNTDSIFSFLSAKNYIGRVKDLKIVLEEFDIEDENSDGQRYMSHKLLESLEGSLGVSIGLDTKQELFQPIYTENEDAWEFRAKYDDGSGLYLYTNKFTGSKAVVLHAPGPSTRPTLAGMSNYVANGYTGFYHNMQHVAVPGVDVYPLALGLFFIGTPFEEEFVERVLSLDLDKSQVHLYVYYGPGSRLRIDEKVQEQFQSFHFHAVTTNLECTTRSMFLRNAKKVDARFALMLDSDTIVERGTTVSDLASWNETVVVGHAQRQGQHWSNFWTDMTTDGWYKKGFDTDELYSHERMGLWQVPFARSILLIRHDVLDRVADHYSNIRDPGDGFDCSQNMCLAAFDDGLPIFADNRYYFATLLGSDTYTKPEALHPELYEAEVSPYLWARRYLVPEFWNVPLDEPCRDVYGGVVFTQRFCDELIATAEAINKWESSGNYGDPHPTQDIQVEKLEWEDSWTYILQEYIRPFVKEKYEGVTFHGEFQATFVVRYWMDGQRELGAHNDESTVTSSILLNSNFTGGGVEFTRYNCTHISHEPGSLLLHPGRVTHNHKAHPITSGRRYVLVSFND